MCSSDLGEAGADHVIPAGLSAAGDGDDVVERQLGRGELPPAVLAAVAVAQIDVSARELHLLPWQAVEDQELYHVRNEDVAARGADVVVVRLDGDVRPVLEVVGPVLGVDGLDLPLVEQSESAACRSDLHGLEDPVQNEDVTIEHSRLHNVTGSDGCFRRRMIRRYTLKKVAL